MRFDLPRGPMLVRIALAVACIVIALGAAIRARRHAARDHANHYVVYIPTEPDVLTALVTLAEVRPDDVVYDLGCGDGRLVIRALLAGARRGVCVDLNPLRIVDAEVLAARAGVLDRMTFIVGDVRTTHFDDATLVFLYLSRQLDIELAPRLQKLAKGSRVVSHWHDMGDWKPDRTLHVNGSVFGERNLYRWTIR